MWEEKIKLDNIREIRTKTTTYFGVGAISKIEDIAKEFSSKGIHKIAVITGKSAYKKTGAWEIVTKALEKYEIAYVLFDKVTPNPNSVDCDEAVQLAYQFGAQAVIGIGGGSPIDTAKTVAVMCYHPESTTADLYEGRVNATKALPIVAINTTHGTGTEVNRFAVMSLVDKQFKPSIGYEFCYPTYSIDDPALMIGLSKRQTIYTSIDAVCHVIEAATTKIASPYTILLAKETIRLVNKYLPRAIENLEDLTARYYLTYAAMIAGTCFDNGFLHLPHALEHPLSGMKPQVIHGHGLAILLPTVIEKIYPACAEVLAEILSPIGEAKSLGQTMDIVRSFIERMGVHETLSDLGFVEQDVDRLVELVINTPSLEMLLSLSPIEVKKELLKEIYMISI